MGRAAVRAGVFPRGRTKRRSRCAAGEVENRKRPGALPALFANNPGGPVYMEDRTFLLRLFIDPAHPQTAMTGIANAMHMHYNMYDPMTTLEQFVEQSGGRAKAAVLIGIAETTLWRWTRGRSQPRGLALRRLMELGIQWEQGTATDKIARVVQVRPAAEAFAKNEEEMLLGMLSMSPGARVSDVDLLRVRLGGLKEGGGKPAPISRVARVARIARRGDA